MTRQEIFDRLFAAAAKMYDDREAKAVAFSAMENIYGVSRMELTLEPGVNVAEIVNIDTIVGDLGIGRPVQYVTGIADFAQMEMAVAEGVLIPRPETEELVRWITEESDAGAKILDVGTGSGAIAIALSKHITGSRVYGIDISAAALETSRMNAERQKTEVVFSYGDALRPFTEWGGAWDAGSFDTIVSNPPYIPRSEMAQMHINVKGFEPHEALFVDDENSLVFYDAIAENAMELLRKGGRLFLEIHEKAGDRIIQALAAKGFTDIELRKDINGKDRMIRAVKG